MLHTSIKFTNYLLLTLFLSVQVSVAAGFTVGGDVSGLEPGNFVVLQNNGSDNVTVSSNGSFTFAGSLQNGDTYNVLLLTQPLEPDQDCTVGSGSGTIARADVSNIKVDCVTLPSKNCLGGIGYLDVIVRNKNYNSTEVVHCRGNNSLTVSGSAQVSNNTALYLQSPQVSLDQLQVQLGSRLHVTTIDPRLNDSGRIFCADATNEKLPCPVANFPNQDAEAGRDFSHYDDGDGNAGFSFTKIDTDGYPLPASAATWSCVRDNLTGLIWEVKTEDGLLHDTDNTYSWYNPDNSSNGGWVGVANGGSCVGSSCDTDDFVAAVNVDRLCGAQDWRMPGVKELEGISDYSRNIPAIDQFYFPNTLQSAFYWTAKRDASNTNDAWVVYSRSGLGSRIFSGASSLRAVRLVRDAP